MFRSYTKSTVNWDPVIVSCAFSRPADTTQYAIGDAISDSTSAPTVLTFSDVGTDFAQFFTLDFVIVTTTAKQSTLPQINLWLFDAAPTAVNDNAAFALSDAENDSVLRVVELTSVYSATNNARLENFACESLLRMGSTTKNLYGALVAANTYTPVASETFNVTIGGYRS